LSLPPAALKTFLDSQTNDITRTVSTGGIITTQRQCSGVVLHTIIKDHAIYITLKLTLQKAENADIIEQLNDDEIEAECQIALICKSERKKRSGI